VLASQTFTFSFFINIFFPSSFFFSSPIFLIFREVFIGFWEVLNSFLISWSWWMYCKPLIRTYWGAWWLHCQDWLSCPLLRPCRSNYEVIIAWDHLNLVKGVYTFHLDPTLLNLEVCNSTFMCLKLPTRLAETVKTKMQADEWHAFTFFSLSLNDMSFRVFYSGFEKFDWVPALLIAFNYTSNCFQIFNFMQFHSYQTQLSAPKLIVIFILVLGSKFMHFYPQLTNKLLIFFNLTRDLVNSSLFIHTPFLVWCLVLDFFNQVFNCPLNFNIYAIKLLIEPN
jgi:hypothetical protein